MGTFNDWLVSPGGIWFFLGAFTVWAVVDLTRGSYGWLAVDLVWIVFYIWALT